MSLRMAPIDVLSMLNGIFATFDDLCDVHRAFKLDIIVSRMGRISWHAPGRHVFSWYISPRGHAVSVSPRLLATPASLSSLSCCQTLALYSTCCSTCVYSEGHFPVVATQGDAYIAVSGIEPECSDHCACRRHSAAVMAALALDMVDAVRALPPCNGAKIQIRVGLHVGPLVAGVVGSKRPKYTLVGETMNLGECSGHCRSYHAKLSRGDKPRPSSGHVLRYAVMHSRWTSSNKSITSSQTPLLSCEWHPSHLAFQDAEQHFVNS